MTVEDAIRFARSGQSTGGEWSHESLETLADAVENRGDEIDRIHAEREALWVEAFSSGAVWGNGHPWEIDMKPEAEARRRWEEREDDSQSPAV